MGSRVEGLAVLDLDALPLTLPDLDARLAVRSEALLVRARLRLRRRDRLRLRLRLRDRDRLRLRLRLRLRVRCGKPSSEERRRT